MPRKDSKARYIVVVARWLEWRCGAKWQNTVVIKSDYGGELVWTGYHYRSEGYEDLIDSLITEDGPPNQKEIAARIAKLGIEELREMAAVAERRSFLFRDGRPRAITYNPYLIAEIEDKTRRGKTVRNASRLAQKQYLGMSSEALRQRYLKAKKAKKPLP